MEKVKEEDKNNGGFSVSKDGISCFTCRCKRNFINKTKKKTVDENGRTTVEENIETCSLGFGNRGTTPELQPRTLTLEERIEQLERKIDRIRDSNIRDIDTEFKRSVSHEERLEIRLNNLEKELEMLNKYHNLKLLD